MKRLLKYTGLASAVFLLAVFFVGAWKDSFAAPPQGSTTVGGVLNQGSTLPATCNPAGGDASAKVFYLTSGTTGLYSCTAVNTWTLGAGGASLGANNTWTGDQSFKSGDPLIDAKGYGVVCDAATDNTANLNTAIAAVGSIVFSKGSGGELFIPKGNCGISSPLINHNANLAIRGWSKSGTVISIMNGFRGPMFVSTPPLSVYPGVPTGTALLTGTGSSWSGDGGVTYWLDFRDCIDCAELNGLAAFTAEATIKPTTVTVRNGILRSTGTPDSVTGQKQAFALWTETDASLHCELNTGGTNHAISGGTLTANTAAHVACSWDGTTLRAFVAGTQVASTAVSGTISQHILEQVTLGRDTGGSFPEGAVCCANSITGFVDGVRLSNVARYTANFTAPTAKWGTPNSSTLVQLNFDNQTDIFTVGRNATNAPVYLPIHRSVGGASSSLRVSDITFDTNSVAEGPFLVAQTSTIWRNFSLTVSHNGLLLSNNNFDNHFFDIDFTNFAGARFNLAAGDASAISVFEKVHANTSTSYPFIFKCSGGIYNEIFIQVSQGVVIPTTFRGGCTDLQGQNTAQVIIQSMYVDWENADTLLTTNLLLDQLGTATIIGGDITCNLSNNCLAPLTIQGGTSYNIIGTKFGQLLASQASAIHVPSPFPTGPITIIGSTKAASPAKPWIDTAAPSYIVDAGNAGTSGMGFSTGKNTITFSATPVFDCTKGNTQKITLTGNVTSSTLTGCADGQEIITLICQDATGNRTFTFPTNMLGATTIGATASKCSAQKFQYDAVSGNAYATALGVINQ